MKLYRDYETLSVTDLTETGAFKYAEHPSTDAYCLAIRRVNADDTVDQGIWVNPRFIKCLPANHGLPLITTDQLKALYKQETPSESHNDAFEQCMDAIMQERYEVPMIPLELRSCSAAQAATNALPRKLETLTEALGLAAEGKGKDKVGHALMMKMCKPLPMSRARWKIIKERFGDYAVYHEARAVYKSASSSKGKAYTNFIADNWQRIINDGCDPQDFLFWHYDECPEDVLRLCQYCLSDVEVEHAAGKLMPEMNTVDQKFWQYDQVVNRRGVHIDIKGAQDAVNMVNTYKSHMQAQLSGLTKGAIKTVGQNEAIKDWCAKHDVVMPNMAKDTVQYFLNKKDLPDKVKKVLKIRSACGQTSVTKYEAMLRAASITDNRVRGVFVYGGAATGRHTATLLQLHNMPRGTIKLKTDEALDTAFNAMACGWPEVELLYGDVMGLAASAIRGCITAAPGYEFLVSDFSSIEARKILWLAGDDEGLQLYRDGLDAYIIAASGIFGKLYEHVTEGERLVGKVAILSLGFGGGIGAFASMARNYNIDLETLAPLVLPSATGFEYKKSESIAKTYLENLEKRIKLKLEKNVGDASFLDRMSLEAAIACDIIKYRWRVARPLVTQLWGDMSSAAFAAIRNPNKIYPAGNHIVFGMSPCRQYLLMQLPSGRCLRYYKPEIRKRQKFGKPTDTITFMRMVNGKWLRTDTYGGKLAENATQASSNCLLRYSMNTVEAEGYQVVLHIHDEPATEVPIGFGSQEHLNALVAHKPGWAKGLPMEAKGWRGRRYRKS